MDFYSGKIAVVTGAREGVGRTIALKLACAGAKLILVSRSKPQETMDEIAAAGGICLGYSLCDIAVEEQVVAMAKEVKELSGGRVDILVNNAGFNGKAHLIKDMVLADWQYTISVNLTGTMLVCRELIPLMSEHGGAICNMSSNVSRRGLPMRSDYVCSKWAIRGLTQTLALELVDKNIRVNAVCPGPIDGDRADQLIRMHAQAENRSYDDVYNEWMNVPMKRFMAPEEVADVVMFLCSDKASAMTGQALNITGGMLMT